MSHYKHLSILEREKLHECRAQKKNLSEIARELERSKSTISRELKRNGYPVSGESYSPSNATENYRRRRKNGGRKKMLLDVNNQQVVLRLFVEKHWSPEQIAHRLKLEGKLSISYATIYRAIHSGIMEPPGTYRNHGHSFPLERRLRHKNHKYRKVETRGKRNVPNRIEDRPVSANNRTRFGHFEADTVHGKKSSDFLVTLVDRRARFLLMKKCSEFDSDVVSSVVVELLKPYKKRLRSITPDRGVEFAGHEVISDELETKLYFANPSSPWERGTNENTNGLIREFFPKKVSMNTLTDEQVSAVQDLINFRPRKCLNWKSPAEVFFHKSLRLT